MGESLPWSEALVLIAYVERLTRILRAFEWGDESDYPSIGLHEVCLFCGEKKEDGHATDCELKVILDNARGLLEENNNDLEQ